MIRKLSSLAVLAMIPFVSGQAQLFKYDGAPGGSYMNLTGSFVSGAPAGFVNGPSFQVWCVDEQHYGVGNGGQYNVNTTRLNALSFANTRQGNDGAVGNAAAGARYARAAGIASAMTSSNAFTYQAAIWSVMHGKTGLNLCKTSTNNVGGVTGGDYYSGCLSDVVTALNNTTAVTGPALNNWIVITANPVGSGIGQEYIARCGTDCGFTPPSENGPTPEPASMTLVAMGLTAMAGAGLRRKKKTV